MQTRDPFTNRIPRMNPQQSALTLVGKSSPRSAMETAIGPTTQTKLYSSMLEITSQFCASVEMKASEFS